MDGKANYILLPIFALLPAVAAFAMDGDLSSNAHIAVIGVAATAVALSDALFGQIVVLTGEMPFKNWKTPAEAERNIKAFDSYHRKVFWAWAVAKSASALSILLPAVTLAARRGDFVWNGRVWILGTGYLALGIAIASAVFFIASYWKARNAAAEIRLLEITRTYQSEHFEKKQPSEADIAEEERQNEAMSRYDSPPQEAVESKR